MAPVEKFAYHPDPVTNELAATLLEELECQQDILGIFLSGSTANGGRDKYSDIDISLIVENRSAFKARLPLIVGRNVDILFSFEPDFLLPDFFIFISGPGISLIFIFSIRKTLCKPVFQNRPLSSRIQIIYWQANGQVGSSAPSSVD